MYQLVKTGAGNFDDVLLHRQFVVYPPAKVPDDINRFVSVPIMHRQSEIILLQLGQIVLRATQITSGSLWPYLQPFWRYSASKNGLTLKPGFGVLQGH